MMKIVRWPALVLLAGLVFSSPAFAQGNTTCARPPAGSVVSPPPDLYSKNGALKVALDYYTTVDQWGRTLFCFQTPDGKESPTLHVNPGDKVEIDLTNMVPAPPDAMVVGPSTGACGDGVMTTASVNMHFHGTNVAPRCHSDEVIRTLVNSGHTFHYELDIPKNEPPGLYWYHPHVHGIASPAVQGGATGIIEVEGIANIQPIVAGLPERFLLVRDGPLQHPLTSATKPIAPYWDLSLNYVPVPFPHYPPSIIRMNPGQQEFWRVANTAADTIVDLQLVYDGVVQPVTVVGLDGVPVGSHDGKHHGTTFAENDVYIPPAGRAEFIVTAPSTGVKQAMLITRRIDTGPLGDNDPPRPLATIQLTQGDIHLPRTQERNGPPNPQRFENLADAKVTAVRHLYFSEVFIRKNQAPPPPWGGKFRVYFYVTVDGQLPKLFNPFNPPAITTTQGAVEDWIIANRASEVHEFHMHQIHFLLLEVNGKPVPKQQQQLYDTYQVPYWKGRGPFPSIKVRMDFRGAVVGDFVYHCHILDHEDGGMMATIRVLPKS